MVKTLLKSQVNLQLEQMAQISTIPLECMNNGDYFDCILLTSSGSKFFCHKIALSFASPFFDVILKDCPAEVAQISIPDIKSDTVELIVSFIYTGEVSVTASKKEEFIEACQFFKLKAVHDLVVTADEVLQEHQDEDHHQEEEIEIAEMEDEPMDDALSEQEEKPVVVSDRHSKVRVEIDDEMRAVLIEKLEGLIRKSYVTVAKSGADHKVRVMIHGKQLVKGLFNCVLCQKEISVMYTTDKKGRFKQWVNSNMRRHLARIHSEEQQKKLTHQISST